MKLSAENGVDNSIRAFGGEALASWPSEQATGRESVRGAKSVAETITGCNSADKHFVTMEK